MDSLYKFFGLLGVAALLFASCDDEYGSRKESTPVIESASISPVNFTFGDSLLLTASIADPATTLSMLDYEVVTDNRVIASGSIPVNGESVQVSHAVFVPLLSKQADNAAVRVNLRATNILKSSVLSEITGLTGKRPAYSRLYLVTDNGHVAVLTPQTADTYTNDELAFDSSFSFKLAEKITPENAIDYSGAVFGNVNGSMAMIDEKGAYSFAYTPGVDYIRSFAYDNYAFSVTAAGSTLGADDLALSAFGEQAIYNESFRTLKRTLENGKTYTLVGKLAEAKNVYNPDFFERLSDSNVKFLGETGEYTIYYNPVRKHVFVGVDNPAYPQYLLACGYGLGYPTRVTSAEIDAVYSGHNRTHTDWGFGHVMNYVLLRRISDGVYQGTFYTPGDHNHYAGFKPFENTGWGNEKKAGSFTFTGEKIISGDNDWTIPNGDNDPVIESANYRFTINLTDNTVHIEKITV